MDCYPTKPTNYRFFIPCWKILILAVVKKCILKWNHSKEKHTFEYGVSSSLQIFLSLCPPLSLRLWYRYWNWTLVLVPDTNTWFRSYTSPFSFTFLAVHLVFEKMAQSYITAAATWLVIEMIIQPLFLFTCHIQHHHGLQPHDG